MTLFWFSSAELFSQHSPSKLHFWILNCKKWNIWNLKTNKKLTLNIENVPGQRTVLYIDSFPPPEVSHDVSSLVIIDCSITTLDLVFQMWVLMIHIMRLFESVRVSLKKSIHDRFYFLTFKPTLTILSLISLVFTSLSRALHHLTL